MEVQAHGNKFEDDVIKERTGLSKDEYDAMKVNGYTSTFDLTQGLIVDYNASIKTTGNNTICCSDLLRMMKHTGLSFDRWLLQSGGKEEGISYTI